MVFDDTTDRGDIDRIVYPGWEDNGKSSNMRARSVRAFTLVCTRVEANRERLRRDAATWIQEA
jgi:hypothetical protein